MIRHIEDTNSIEGVYFEDIDALVSSKSEAWLIVKFYYYYFSTKEAAEKFLSK